MRRKTGDKVSSGGENSPAPPPFFGYHRGSTKWKGGAILALAVWVALPAAAQDGKRQFEAHCAACHTNAESAPAGPGPNLTGLAGRRIAGDPGFDYSPALREAQGQWTPERLATFLDDPEEMFPGLWMGGNGVRDEAARRSIVDYLMGR